MLQDFFDNIKVPEFIKNEFTRKDWYLVIGELREIVNINIKKQELLSQGKNLSVRGNVYIGKECIIGENVVIEGPTYIGDGVEIGPGVYIRPGSVISNKCVVAHAAEIKNTLMMEESKVSNHAFVGDSILGYKARVGGHCETTNRRFDQKEIDFIYKDKRLVTNLDKLGVILGEEARLGGGVFPSPGTMIGKRTFIATVTPVSGYVPPNMYVKLKSLTDITENKFEGALHSKSRIFE
jgi:UDP-N-acetylglucosamine diphosphorylase / glucose-1-phosphate thymidylyltransferase / UDP-N-acetylgalactosamine diphosphorylase / glucosamine-1-phosphate N-acetyltransferase / galactosamine-1-phosphate N-acetyltransferase